MNKQQKLQLEAVVNAVVNEDMDTAKEAFHNYLRTKTQDILLGEKDDCDEDMEEDKKDDKEVDKDLEKVEKSVKKAKKDQKKDEKDDEECDE